MFQKRVKKIPSRTETNISKKCREYNAHFSTQAITEELIYEVIAIGTNGQKLRAIKIFKDRTGLGLKASKNICDYFWENSGSKLRAELKHYELEVKRIKQLIIEQDESNM